MLHYQFLSSWLKAHTKSERGASMVEYALLVALIAVVCIGAVAYIGRAMNNDFKHVGKVIDKNKG